jgi:hypothetical protein
MAEPEQAGSTDSPKTPRSFSIRAERSLKEIDRLLKDAPDRPPQERAMAQVEQAKILALLELAQTIREKQSG